MRGRGPPRVGGPENTCEPRPARGVGWEFQPAWTRQGGGRVVGTTMRRVGTPFNFPGAAAPGRSGGRGPGHDAHLCVRSTDLTDVPEGLPSDQSSRCSVNDGRACHRNRLGTDSGPVPSSDSAATHCWPAWLSSCLSGRMMPARSPFRDPARARRLQESPTNRNQHGFQCTAATPYGAGACVGHDPVGRAGGSALPPLSQLPVQAGILIPAVPPGSARRRRGSTPSPRGRYRTAFPTGAPARADVPNQDGRPCQAGSAAIPGLRIAQTDRCAADRPRQRCHASERTRPHRAATDGPCAYPDLCRPWLYRLRATLTAPATDPLRGREPDRPRPT